MINRRVLGSMVVGAAAAGASVPAAGSRELGRAFGTMYPDKDCQPTNCPSTDNYHVSMKGNVSFAAQVGLSGLGDFRHLGNCPGFHYAVKNGQRLVNLIMDEITPENVMWMSNQESGVLRFESTHTHGPLVKFESFVKMIEAEFSVIRDDWSTITAELEVTGKQPWSIIPRPTPRDPPTS